MNCSEILVENLENIDVISAIDEIVQALARIKWWDDICPPEFLVSLNNEDEDNQLIMITINHLGSKFTEKLFPRKDMHYGYDSLMSQMVNLYNQTM